MIMRSQDTEYLQVSNSFSRSDGHFCSSVFLRLKRYFGSTFFVLQSVVASPLCERPRTRTVRLRGRPHDCSYDCPSEPYNLMVSAYLKVVSASFVVAAASLETSKIQSSDSGLTLD